MELTRNLLQVANSSATS